MWDQIEYLIQLSSQPLSDGEVDPGKNPERRNYYRFLYHLTNWLRPAVALEIGVESGLASRYMTRASALYGGHVIGVDLNDPGLTMPNYHFVGGDSTRPETVLRVADLAYHFGPIGLVYQDSSHHYQASRDEWRLYSPLLGARAVWICDDITPAFHDPLIDPPGKGMVQYFAELPGEKRLYKDVLHYGNIQGIVLVCGGYE